MHTSGSDDSGPRIDMGDFSREETGPAAGYTAPTGYAAPASAPPSSLAAPAKGGGFSKAVSILALVFSLSALGLYLFGGQASEPETMAAQPRPETGVSPGAAAAAERVRKLEQDVQNLMLSLNDLQGEVANIRSKAGAVNKVAELSAKVAALQGRIERLDDKAYENAVTSLAKSRQQAKPEPKAEEQKPEPKPEPKAEPPAVKKPAPKETKPAKKKHVYKIKPGESLFAIAARYKVSVNDLKKWNDIKKTSKIYAGQTLVIWLDR